MIYLRPRQTQYKKRFKKRYKIQMEKKQIKLKYGIIGLQALETAILTSHQIELIRRTITHFIKRRGRIWIRIFPDKPFTQKAKGLRMGKGKGNVINWIIVIKPGMILYEVNGPHYDLLVKALKNASQKLAFLTQIIKRDITHNININK